ncbi:hypothetical protein KKC44_01780 [Patescibacteria group bacterium]|nr:hypothetical protein [Patescibacteria group bacterium]MBU2259312.1 hypothetical protein [Patescibacteria group bacterium]
MPKEGQERAHSQLPDSHELRVDNATDFVEYPEKLNQLQSFVEKQYGIKLSNPPSLYDLMRVDQFAYLVPEDLAQREALKKARTGFVLSPSGIGAGGFTPKDGRNLQLFFQPYFNDIEDYAERTPMTTGFHSPSVFMHEATHLADYKNILPKEEILKVRDIIAAAHQRGSDAFMTKYSTSEYSEFSDDSSEVLTTITERYVDNPVRFVNNMNHPNNVDERKLAVILIDNHMLPSDALDMEGARRKLRASNRYFMRPEACNAIGDDVETLVQRDAANLTAYLRNPYLGLQLLEKEHEAEFKESSEQLLALDTELKEENLDPEMEIDLMKKRDSIRDKLFILRNELMKQALAGSTGLESLLDNQPILQNYSSLMVLFFRNGFRPNMSRSIRNIIDNREEDVLAMAPSILSAHLRNPDVVEFMTILRDAAGVEFALQDVVEIANVIKEFPELLSKMRDTDVQGRLFDLQCAARFRNSDDNVRNLAQFVLTGQLLREAKSFESYEHHRKL